MTTVLLATGPGPGKNGARYEKGMADHGELGRPALLVSYLFLKIFEKHRHRMHFRDWVMDSGAFSAWTAGAVIDLPEYIETARRLLVEDDQLTEVFSLDVIGDWRASLKNVETMWKAGVEAIPTFHVGEPWDVLTSIAADYPKIALGGMVGYQRTKRDAWIGQCFARVWPKRIHGFGIMGEDALMSYPFESVDASNWELAPTAFGSWAAFGGANLKVRGGEQNLRPEVERILKIERKLKWRWRREMAALKELEG